MFGTLVFWGQVVQGDTAEKLEDLPLNGTYGWCQNVTGVYRCGGGMQWHWVGWGGVGGAIAGMMIVWCGHKPPSLGRTTDATLLHSNYTTS